MWRALLACVIGCGCGAPSAAPALPRSGSLLLRGATVVGQGVVDVEVDGGTIVAVGPALEPRPDTGVLELGGRWLAPQIIDSHVHLAYWPVAEELSRRGVAGVVDLAAPVSFLGAPHGGLEVVASGPMITAPGGYPLSSWGEDGYGLPCASAEEAARAVEELHRRGARLIKIPFGAAPELAPDAVRAAIDRAHALGLKVAVHALGDDAARRAAEAGADVLAHTPTEPLSAATVALWRDRAVISTLSAFGGASVENLARLRAAGARVLYGTDLGNTRDAGISARELRLLGEAGLAAPAILAAATTAPAAFWGMDDLGAIAPGRAARLLVLDADPLADPAALASPSATLP
jgi:imidazolonepropionase-like amidohydrolase